MHVRCKAAEVKPLLSKALAETARRPLLARTSAFIGQHDGTLSASWLGSPHAASR